MIKKSCNDCDNTGPVMEICLITLCCTLPLKLRNKLLNPRIGAWNLKITYKNNENKNKYTKYLESSA